MSDGKKVPLAEKGCRSTGTAFIGPSVISLCVSVLRGSALVKRCGLCERRCALFTCRMRLRTIQACVGAGTTDSR